MRQIHNFTVLVILVSCIFCPSVRAQREVKVTPVPSIKAVLKPPQMPKQSVENAMEADEIEHARKKKEFLQELQKDASEFKDFIKTVQEAEIRKTKENEFRESRKKKIEEFLADEKSREAMVKS